MPPRLTPARRSGLAAALAVLAADQASKLWLIHSFDLAANGPVEVTPFLRIVLAFNPGISYSLFSAQSPVGRWALLGLTLAATAALAAWLWRAPDGVTASGLGLIVGGALGNGIDRLIYGAVVDFLNFRLGSFSPFGVFNLADTAIFAGVGLLLYRTLYPSGPIRP